MSSNKGARQALIQKFGKICMIEEAGIRKIPLSERRKIKGYKKSDDQITYHHLRAKRNGGRATEENGALVKGYNHQWLERLPEEEREVVNSKLREFKLNFSGIAITDNGIETVESGSVPLEFNFENNDSIIIPVFDCQKSDKKRKQKPKTRAQLKKETQERIAEDLEIYYEAEEDFDR